jgi:hypothetical protein
MQPPVLSDHMPLTFGVKALKPTPTKEIVTYRKLNVIDMEKFKSDITESNLINSPSSDLDELVNQYNSSLKTIMDKHAPLISKVVTTKPNTPWFNSEIKQAITDRRRSERKWIKSKLQIYLSILKENRLKVTSLCAKAKEKYYQDKIANSNGNQTHLFKIVNDLMHKKKYNNIWQNENNKELANEFVDFFSTKISKINNAFPPSQQNDAIEENTSKPEFNAFKPIEAEIIKKCILEGNSKSCHLDPTIILKQVIDHLLPAITKIVNLSFCT